jgi:NADPH-dependent F420 reductase
LNNESIRIGTLGTGRMAGNLGRLWAAKGHQVFFGSRDPYKAKALAESAGSQAQGGTYAEAAAFGEVVLLATPWTVAEETLHSLGSLDGKILVDMTNPIRQAEAGMELALRQTTSFAEALAKQASGAKVVKAFNSIYFAVLEKPSFGDERASSFFCGDDEQAKAVVAQLSRDIGFEPVDSGPLWNARLLEPLAVLWMQLAFSGSHGSDIAFKLLKR